MLLAPRVIDQSAETDERYEGLHSSMRELVPRPLHLAVETASPPVNS
ncbi:hypothetical protein [Nocardia grenadensis]